MKVGNPGDGGIGGANSTASLAPCRVEGILVFSVTCPASHGKCVPGSTQGWEGRGRWGQSIAKYSSWEPSTLPLVPVDQHDDNCDLPAARQKTGDCYYTTDTLHTYTRSLLRRGGGGLGLGLGEVGAAHWQTEGRARGDSLVTDATTA